MSILALPLNIYVHMCGTLLANFQLISNSIQSVSLLKHYICSTFTLLHKAFLIRVYTKQSQSHNFSFIQSHCIYTHPLLFGPHFYAQTHLPLIHSVFHIHFTATSSLKYLKQSTSSIDSNKNYYQSTFISLYIFILEIIFCETYKRSLIKIIPLTSEFLIVFQESSFIVPVLSTAFYPMFQLGEIGRHGSAAVHHEPPAQSSGGTQTTPTLSAGKHPYSTQPGQAFRPTMGQSSPSIGEGKRAVCM